MTGRLFWFAVGVSATVYATVKIRRYLDQASPEAVGRRVAGRLTQARGEAIDFVDRARAAMAESEADLRRDLGLPQQP